ncbi:MAG: hemolysin III family protein [Acidobacteria bacterium]|nr:MAG: hemolysin III family protein [Acidobacteriota bacterium]
MSRSDSVHWPAETAVDRKAFGGRQTTRREPSLGEEIANCVSHGVGLVAALVGTPFLVVAAARRGGADAIVGASVFAGTVVVLYLASTLYHALPKNKAKRVFQVIDHSAIFLLIAGTYTPFTLGVLRGAWGWTLFSVVWGLAVFGVTLKSMGGIRYPRLSTMLYVGMGWLALIAIRPLWLQVPVAGWLWLIAGGLAYTAGIAFYAAERLRYGHFVWHMFVLVGTACHFVAVLWYAA